MRHSKTRINPISLFGSALYGIQKPARYIGGEVGSHPAVQENDERFSVALCFPDLYEIGMSNIAIRILYNDLGKLSDSIISERVFTPAPDFEALLKTRAVPLFSLESGIPLCEFDVLGFSVGYEMLATNILTVLDTGMIPLLAAERSEKDPIVIAGGPAISNPKPFGKFLDAVYIGEAEAEFYKILEDMSAIKKNGGTRSDLLDRLSGADAVWMPPMGDRSEKRARRAAFSGFSSHEANTAFPVPILQAVHSHGTVEIMRGCPNGCRFCHAGYFYRPQRAKDRRVIHNEVARLINNGGYREITLSSLSTGDYPDIVSLFRELNDTWKTKNVSFQLPSLRVDSFTLPLLKEISEVRKSGLTFAVETPTEEWQRSINKTVNFDKIVDILKEAKSSGFRSAKFYFMIGLPVPGKGRGEAQAIVDFLRSVATIERFSINVNIGTFIPKPHTPYENDGQLTEDEALDSIYLIKDSLRQYRNIIISYQSPFLSSLEGIISRGDERVGDILLSAYRSGARFDAWDEHFNRTAWINSFEEAKRDSGYDPVSTFLSPRDITRNSPWEFVQIGVGDMFLENEKEKSDKSLLTGACAEECDHWCGACNDEVHIVSNVIHDQSNDIPLQESPVRAGFSVSGTVHETTLPDRRLVFTFKKSGPAVLYPLHSLLNLFSRMFYSCNIPVRYTQGFNPMPRMEMNQPLALGIESEDEILAVWLSEDISIYDIELFKDNIQKSLPGGIELTSIKLGISRTAGKNSIGSLYWGSSYSISSITAADTEKIYSVIKSHKSCHSIEIDSRNMSVSIVLNDSKGGEDSLVKILGTVFPGIPLFDHVKIFRKEILGLDTKGNIPGQLPQRLSELL